MSCNAVMPTNVICQKILRINSFLIKITFFSDRWQAADIGTNVQNLSTFSPPRHLRDQRDSRFSRILENFFSFSLLVLDLEPFQFHFHFSKKSEGILFFTFHFSKKVKAIRISLFFLEKKEWNQVRAITSPLSLFPIVFPKIVKSQVSTSLKILAKFQFQNLD